MLLRVEEKGLKILKDLRKERRCAQRVTSSFTATSGTSGTEGRTDEMIGAGASANDFVREEISLGNVNINLTLTLTF